MSADTLCTALRLRAERAESELRAIKDSPCECCEQWRREADWLTGLLREAYVVLTGSQPGSDAYADVVRKLRELVDP